MTTPREYPEPEAWRRIAARLELRGVEYGLCDEATKMRRARRSGYDGISYPTLEVMLDRIENHLDVMPHTGLNHWRENVAPVWGWPKGEAAEDRALAAYFLALEAESEAA